MSYRRKGAKQYFPARFRFKAPKAKELTREAQKELTETLQKIYEFSAERGFRYGLNEKYIGARPETLTELYEQGYIFYKKAHGQRYWLPTKKGRSLFS